MDILSPAIASLQPLLLPFLASAAVASPQKSIMIVFYLNCFCVFELKSHNVTQRGLVCARGGSDLAAKRPGSQKP